MTLLLPVFQLFVRLRLVIKHELDCTNQPIIAYNWWLVHHCVRYICGWVIGQVKLVSLVWCAIVYGHVCPSISLRWPTSLVHSSHASAGCHHYLPNDKTCTATLAHSPLCLLAFLISFHIKPMPFFYKNNVSLIFLTRTKFSDFPISVYGMGRWCVVYLYFTNTVVWLEVSFSLSARLYILDAWE